MKLNSTRWYNFSKDQRDKVLKLHDEQTCNVCKIIDEEQNQIEEIKKINIEKEKEGLEIFDNGSRIPVHCMWCITNVVWDGDKWCSEQCYDNWTIWVK